MHHFIRLRLATPQRRFIAAGSLLFSFLLVAGMAMAMNTPAPLKIITPAMATDQPYYQQVAVQTLTQQDEYAIERLYSGTVNAQQHASISFELGGKIARVNVKTGDKVKKGQVLAQLDTTTLKIEKRQTRAKIDDVDAQIVLVQANLKRQLALRDEGFSSAQKLDELNAQKISLQSAKQQLFASIDLLDTHIRHSRLLAPFTGSITQRYVDKGHVINAGTAVLKVQQLGQMEVFIGVPVALTHKLTLADSYPVNIHATSYNAKLLSIGSDIQAQTRTVLLRLALPATAQVFNGDLAQLHLQEKVQQSGFWVPATAVTDGMRGLWSVYVLNHKTPGQSVIEKRDIHIHHAQSQSYFISGALNAGETLVSTGLQKLVPGQKVQINSLFNSSGSIQL